MLVVLDDLLSQQNTPRRLFVPGRVLSHPSRWLCGRALMSTAIATAIRFKLLRSKKSTFWLFNIAIENGP